MITVQNMAVDARECRARSQVDTRSDVFEWDKSAILRRYSALLHFHVAKYKNEPFHRQHDSDARDQVYDCTIR